MALGHGEQIGYSNLIESLLGHSLDKGARFTDWSRRPLDKRQIDYAIADVTHLAEIFPRMVEKLRKTGRGAWLDEEMERLADPSSFAFAPEDAWKRLKLPSRNPAVLGRLKALAGVARDRGAVEEPAARADHQGRHAGRDRLPPAQDAGGPRPGPRAVAPAGGTTTSARRLMAAIADGQAARARTSCPTASPSGPA